MRSIENAFHALDYETLVVAYDTPIHPWKGVNKLRWKWLGRDAAKRRSRHVFSHEVIAALRSFAPSFIMVVNGDMLTEQCARALKHSAPMAVWLFDSIRKYPECATVVGIADHVFCYERDDIPYIETKFGRVARFLPQAVDERLYYKMEGVDKDLDIVFAGDVWQSAKRQRVLEAVVGRFGGDCRVKIWGRATLFSKTPLRYLRMKLSGANVWMNRDASAETLNRDYNRARVVLNVHNEQQRDGANPKVYEIAATGAYQLCDRNPYIETLFKNGEIGLYDDVDDLLSKIENALASAPSGEEARQQVLAHDTMTHRVEHVLSFFR